MPLEMSQEPVTSGDLEVTPASGSATVVVGRLSSTTNDNTSFRVRDRSDNTLLSSSPSIPLQIGRDGSEFARIDTSGRLLVGTTSGAGKFIVQDSSLPKIQANYNGTRHVELGIGDSGCGFAMVTGHFMTFNHQPYANRGTDTNLTERMRIDTTLGGWALALRRLTHF